MEAKQWNAYTISYLRYPCLMFFILPAILFLDQGGIAQSSEKAKKVIIQPLGNIPAQYVDHVKKRIAALIPAVEVQPAIPLPSRAYYKPRGRYRADSLIKIMASNTADGNVTIGITIEDISCTNGQYPDWGVFGLSYCPGKACVASSFRSKSNQAEGLFETAIHELGHTQGLDHCPDKNCIMQDAEGHNIRAKKFCLKCKKYLVFKGWML